ncbi:Nucleotidylyl transferase, partial [Caulochytrium protostelioides]
LEPSAAARPRYLLTMFPYPSGQLHMGHLRVYTLPDVLARYHRQRGRRVFFPIGWDAFGLPAENAARQHGVDPEAWTRRNIAEMREVLQDIGIAFDWDHEVATCDADYYRWTQWLFLQLYRHGYVYRKRALVNWDPVDQTVLANEQIDTHGRAERSGAQVELRPMTQWFVAMRRKVPELLRDLDLLQWPQNVKTLQRDWIGAHPAVTQPITVLPVAGTPLSASPSAPPPEPLGLAVVLTPEAHERFLAGDACAAQLLAGGAATLGSEDRFRSSDASDSSADAAEARRLPLEAVVPADRRGALKRVPVSAVLQTDVLESPAVVVWRDGSCQRESEPAGESDSEDRSMAPPSSAMAPAQPTTLYHLRDWLVSRQRRWGTPIPIIHCEASCGPVPVPDEHLPFHPATATLRHCPQCGSDAIRYETDTLDTFVDSSWYWLRYLDPRNDRQLAAPEILAKALPVDLYVGGVEHAIMHLLYARFFYKFIMTDLDLAGWRALPRRDAPAGPLLAQGMVLGKTYRAAGSGRYLTRAQQAAYESRAAAASPAPSDGAAAPDGAVVVTYEKMSKSKFNGVAPTDTVARWGRDVTRLYMLVRAPPADDLKWDESAIIGMARWLRRVHHL